jgi:transcriptional regulator with XRE-family HTH domain
MSTQNCKKIRIGRNLLQSVAGRFRQIRLSLGYKTQAAFAEHLGIAKKTIWSIENGAQLPGTEVLINLRKLGIDINLLLQSDTDMAEAAKPGARQAPVSIHSAQSLLLFMLENNLDAPDLQFFTQYYTADCKTRMVLRAFFTGEETIQQKKG